MNKPMTTAELFEKICGILKEKGLYPGILDYALAASTPKPITTYDLNSALNYNEEGTGTFILNALKIAL